MPLVEPHPSGELSVEEELRAEFELAGVPEPFASQLSTLLLRHELFPPKHQEDDYEFLADLVPRKAGEIFAQHPDDPGTAILKFANFAYQDFGVTYSLESEAWQVRRRRLARLLSEVTTSHQECTVAAAWRRLGKPHRDALAPGFSEFLRRYRFLSAADEIDLDELRRRADGKISHTGEPLKDNPSTLEYWLHRSRQGALRSLYRVFREEPDETIAAFAVGLYHTIYSWCHLEHSHARHRGFGPLTPGDIESRWRSIEDELAPFADELGRRWERSRGDLTIAAAWWKFMWRVYGDRPGHVSLKRRRQLVRSAKQALGRLRLAIRQADSDDGKTLFIDAIQPLDDGMRVLVRFASLWDVVSSLILALRALPVASVGPDLRYWREPGEAEAPRPVWTWVPDNISRYLAYLRAEQESDPILEEFRTQFATFCLDRLKTRKGRKGKKSFSNDDIVEPDPIWRQCYVRAVRELKVNPRGQGHHVLHWARRNDPDPDVREAAKVAYKEVRHGVGIPPGTSPRRPIFAAIWWLRQAHAKFVGIKVDPAGAQRTLRREIRFTRDP
ncbi:MAG: hypothetical protein O7H41_20785 [Planctomycetota bacterium]|nr:hypothetical protein [Planctomycetota bacterium]